MINDFAGNPLVSQRCYYFRSMGEARTVRLNTIRGSAGKPLSFRLAA